MTQVSAKKTSSRSTSLPKAPAPAANSKTAAAAQPASKGRRVQVKRSGVHGKGVFAVQALAKGERVIEYKGAIISWKEALRRHPHDPSDPNHTFYFHLNDGYVIDGKENGNAARWINHACAPNCEASQEGDQVFIKALRAIKPGEELFYDYGLVIDERITPKLKREYQCLCGARTCRGTMLSGKRK